MLIELIASLLIGELNPADFTGKSFYPSGLHDGDKGFFNLPESKYPVLKISVSIIDINGTTVNPGIYAAKLKDKQILLLQTGEVIAVLPIIVTRNLSQKCELAEAKASIIDAEHVLVNFRENMTESQAIVRIAR